MIMRVESLMLQGGDWVVFSSSDIANLGGWPDVETASRELLKKGNGDREPLICGGYETRTPHPEIGHRERVTFWAAA